MGPLRRAGRRTVLSTAAWLSAVTIFAFVSWFYVFRPDNTSVDRHQPASVFPEKDSPVDIRPDIAAAATTTTTSSTPRSSTTSSSSSSSVSSSPSASASTTTNMKSSSAGAAAAPTVKLRQGNYTGAIIPSEPDTYPKAVETFLGIPYAQSTADENRFRPPIPVPDSTSTFKATAYGHACLGAFSGGPEGEECLNVNVFRPKGTEVIPAEVAGKAEAAPLLPVVIYVHGGGFNAGHGGERNMASFVSWAKPDIIAVSFNYRVGAFGFLPSALTASEGLLNLGLKDQQALFAWVQHNIAAFGGDPDNVTIMGLSAGAHSVGHHIMYYANSSSPAPFAKAILESGATTARAVFYPTHPRHLVQFREFLVEAGIEGVPESDVFPALRKLPAATILKASNALWYKYESSVTWPFQPVIDGPNALSNSSHTNSSTAAIIPDLPLLSWQQGRHLNIPVLTGFNTNEGTVFIPPKAKTTADFRSFFQTLIPGFSSKDLDVLEQLYPDPVTNASSPYKSVPKGMGAQWTRLDAAYSHYAYICPVLQTGHFLSASNSSPDAKSKAAFSKSAHNSYGLRSTVGERPDTHNPSASPPSSNPSTDAAHNSYGLTRSIDSDSDSDSARDPASPASTSFSSSSNPSTNSAHNSYGLSPSPSESSSTTSQPSPAPQEAHNSYGLSTPPPPHPVYVYRYAAASRWGTANHGDEAPVVAHDMAVISAPASATTTTPSPSNSSSSSSASRAADTTTTVVVPRPGLRAVADAMHGAWTNFIVSRDGDPNPVSSSAGREEEEWPVFVSPFGGAAGKGGEKRGRIIVFGEGNDERRPDDGVKTAGTAVKVEALTEEDLEKCRFWWERVELSQGVGKRLDRGRL